MNFLKNNKGISLIEVLVTMGLISVLAAVAIPAYNTYRSNANESVLKSDLSNAYKAYHAYNAVDGTFCAGLDTVGLTSLKESDTYQKSGVTNSFVGFDSTATGCTQTDISEAKGTVSMAKTDCTLGGDEFKLAVINEFGGDEVGFSVDNSNNSPKKGGDYCAVSSTNLIAATGSACQADSTGCGTTSNNCGGTGVAGHWVTGGQLCQ